MVIELIMVSGLGACAAGIAYLLQHSAYEKKAEREQRDKEEAQFRLSLLQEIRNPNAGEFRISDFAAKCGMAKSVVDRVAENVYGTLFGKAIADGSISNREREKLRWLSRALELSPDQIAIIESRRKEEKYQSAISAVLADGEITSEEVTDLERIRKRMGISNEQAFRITGDTARSAYLTTFRRIARDGVITPEEQEELRRSKAALAISDADASEIIQEEAIALYKQWFATVIQDGIVTTEEERWLAWLQEWTGLCDADLEPYHRRIEKVRRLAMYRKGSLPSVRTKIMLEGGEICHWDRPCVYLYETRTKRIRVDGQLVVTSAQVYFIAPSKSLSFKPSRIMDIRCWSDGMELRVNSRQGSGHYLTADADELEAILVGVVAKHKFLLSESYSSAKTRHIPDDVKRAVWDRDAGKCVRCAANDYLEFDHIIPHSRGGANSINNVQLLCRKCNILKSDRI
jgi:tellurite resistance protein